MSEIYSLIREYDALSEDAIQRFHLSTGKYDRAFVINMKARTDRLATVTHTLSKVNIKFERFIAMNGKQIIEDGRYPGIQQSLSTLSAGELGCALSHLSLLSLLSQHHDPDAYTMIFEDDVVTSAQSLQPVLDNIDEIDRDTDIGIVYLGKCLEACSKMTHVRDNIYFASAPLCTHAYMIKHSFASKVMEDLQNCNNEGLLTCDFFNKVLDGILKDYTVNNLVNSLVLHPAFFFQDVLTSSSDLRKEYLTNYQECNDTFGGLSPCPECPKVQVSNDSNTNVIPFIVIAIIVGVIFFILFLKYSSSSHIIR